MACFQAHAPVLWSTLRSCWDDRGNRPTVLYYPTVRSIGSLAPSGRGRRKISLSQVQNLRQPDKRGEYLANTHYGNRVSVGIGRLQVLAAALLFSTGGAGIKAAAFTGLQVSALRSGIAALVLLLLLRGLSTGRGTRMLVFSPATVATGVVYAATVTLFVLSTKLTTAANAIFSAGDCAALSAAARAAHPSRTISRSRRPVSPWRRGRAGPVCHRSARTDDDSAGSGEGETCWRWCAALRGR